MKKFVLLFTVLIVSILSMGQSLEITKISPAGFDPNTDWGGPGFVPDPAGPITGVSPICAPTNGVAYSVAPIAGASTYIWILPPNAVLASGSGTNSITVNYPSGALDGNVIVYGMNTWGAGFPSTYIVVVYERPVPTIGGNTNACLNSTGNVYTTEAGMTNYSWSIVGGTITAGGTATDNTATVTWTSSGSQSISVNYSDLNNCTATTSTSYAVNVYTLPSPTVSGPSPVCFNTTGHVYTTEAGKTNYSWTVSAGGTITAGGTATDNTVTVTWNTAGAQSVSVNYFDANGCTAGSPGSKAVTVNGVTPSIIGPVSPPCKGTVFNMYTTEAGMTNYIWTISAGGTITAGAGTESIAVSWITQGAQSISVIYTDATTCTPASPTVSNFTVLGPTVSGPTEVCRNSTHTFTTEPGKAGYVWSGGLGVTIMGGQGTNSASIKFVNQSTGTPPVPRNVTVTYTDGTCTSATSLPVIVYPSQANITTVGANNPCANTSVSYYTESGQTNYIWALPLAGGTITAGGTTSDNFATVLWTTPGARSVTVTYNSALACPMTPGTKNLTVRALPVPTITGPAGCLTSGHTYQTEAAMTNYLWNVSPGGTITAGGSTTDNFVTVTWTALGAQTVSVNYTNSFGCTAGSPTVKNITVNPLPVPTITGPASACINVAGQIYSTEVGMTGYTWNITGGTINGGAGTNSVSVTWTTTGAQSLTVNYTNANSCSASVPTSKSVTVNPLPTPTIISGPTAPCQLSTGNVYTTQGGKSAYVWNVSAGGTITAGGGAGDNTVTVTWNTVGAQTVSVNYQDANACTAVAPFVYNLDVKALPVPTITGDANACVNTPGHVYTTEVGMTGYTWNITGGTITAGAGTASVTVTWTAVGVGNLTVNYTDVNNCQAVAATIKNVNVHALPVITLGGPTPVCVGIAGNVYTTEAGKSNYVWNVSAGGTITAGGTAADNTVTVTWTTSGSKTVSVNYQDANTCQAASPTVFNVTANALPTPNITGNATPCINVAGVVYTTEAGMSNYVWNVSAGGTVTAGGTGADNTVTVTWTTLGAQTVSVNYQNAASCTAVTPYIYNVDVKPLPTPSIAGPNHICGIPATNQVYTTQAGFNSYVWSVSAGGTITSGAGTNSINVTWATAGAKTVTVNYATAFGCSAVTPASYNVDVFALPVATLTGSSTPCILVSGYLYTTEPGMSNYTWNITGAHTLEAGGALTDNTATVTWNTVGAKTISVTYTDANGCSPATPALVNVDVKPLPVPTISGPAFSCGTGGNVYSTEAGNSGYTWTVSGTGIISSGAGTNSITVDWTGNLGAQTVTVSYTSPFGCVAAAPTVLNVNVLAAPTPTITGPTPVCSKSVKVYTTQAGKNSYVWSVVGGTIIAGSGTNTVQVKWNNFAVPTACNVSVNYSDPITGCSAGAPTNFAVTVNPLPIPTITQVPPFVIGDGVCLGATYTYTTEAGHINYSWNVSPGGTIIGGGTFLDNFATVTWNILGSQSISTNWENEYGCAAFTMTVQPVTVTALPVPTISGPLVACNGHNGYVYATEAGMLNYNWSVPNGTITAGAGTNSITVQWNAVGPQTLSVTYINGAGCSPLAPTNYNVTVNPSPLPVIAGPITACINTGGHIYSTAGGQSLYTWNVTGGIITAGAGTNSITVTWNTVGPQTVSVDYTNASNCNAVTPTIYNVTVNPDATIALSSAPGTDNQSLCINTPITNITYAIGGGGTGAGVVGLPAGVIGSYAAGVFTISGTPTVVGTFNYTVTTTGVCIQTTANGTITVNPDATITLTSGNNNQSPCINTPIVNITYTIGGGGTGAGVIGLPAGVTGAYAAGVFTISGTPIVVGIFNYTVTTTGTCAQVNATGTITVKPDATITLTSAPATINQTLCINTPIIPITYTVGGSGTGATFTGLPAGVNGTYVAGNVTISGSPTVSGTFNYTVNTTGQCVQTSASGTITVNPDASIALTTGNNVQGVCVNVPITPIVYTIGGGGTGAGVVGLPAGMTGVYAAGNFTITGSTTVGGVYNYTVTTTGTCAQTTANGTITVNSLPPSPSLSGPNPVCYHKEEVYSTDPGFTSYTWSVTNGTILSGAGTASILVHWDGTPGLGTVSINYTNVNGCAAALPTNMNVTINPLPNPTLAQVPAAVVGNDVCQASTYTYNTEAGKTNYVWSISPGGTVIGGGTFLHNFVTVTWTVLGPQSVSVNYTNNFGCVAQNVTVFPVTVTAVPTPTVSGSNAVCVGSAGNVYSTEAGMTAYNWTVSAGGVITAGAGTNSITVTWNTAGAQTVNVHYTNASGCTSIVPGSLAVVVSNLPAPTIGGPVTACAVSAGNVYTTEAGMFAYSWLVSAGGSITAGAGTNSITVTWSTAGAQWVSVNYTDALGCPAAAPTVQNVTVYPTFVVGSIGADQTINTGTAPALLTGVAPTGGNTPYTYQWQSSTDNITYNDIPLADGLDYQPPVLTVTTWYRQVQTSAGSCGSLTTNAVKITVRYKVSGYITYDRFPNAAIALQNITVFLKDGPQPAPPATVPVPTILQTTTTDATGYYEFYTVSGTYYIYAASAVAQGGLTNADVINMKNYIGNITPNSLYNALRVRAADLNLDGVVTTTDVTALQRRIGNLLPNPNYKAPDWIYENPSVVVVSANSSVDLMGVCSGDVNGSNVNPN